MSEFEKATPRPWAAGRGPGARTTGGVIVGAAQKECVRGSAAYQVALAVGTDNEGEQEANQALIIRAVNAYEPMREALKAVRARIVEIGGTLPGGGTPYDRAMKMCAAIPVPLETLRKAMDALRAAESPEGTR